MRHFWRGVGDGGGGDREVRGDYYKHIYNTFILHSSSLAHITGTWHYGSTSLHQNPRMAKHLILDVATLERSVWEHGGQNNDYANCR